MTERDRSNHEIRPLNFSQMREWRAITAGLRDIDDMNYDLPESDEVQPVTSVTVRERLFGNRRRTALTAAIGGAVLSACLGAGIFLADLPPSVGRTHWYAPTPGTASGLLSHEDSADVQPVPSVGSSYDGSVVNRPPQTIPSAEGPVRNQAPSTVPDYDGTVTSNAVTYGPPAPTVSPTDYMPLPITPDNGSATPTS